MKAAPTQLEQRENTASARRHASRLTSVIASSVNHAEQKNPAAQQSLGSEEIRPRGVEQPLHLASTCTVGMAKEIVRTHSEGERLRPDQSSQTSQLACTTSILANSEETEFIDSVELARRWSVPVSWVRDQVRSRAEDPLPHISFGKYVRFLWRSPDLEAWVARRIVKGNNRRVERVR
jgi:hypothetical protein